MSDSVERHPTTTYRLNDVLYVPHYRNLSIFIGPGYSNRNIRTYTAFALEDAGAMKETHMLWSRSLFGEVTTANP